MTLWRFRLTFSIGLMIMALHPWMAYWFHSNPRRSIMDSVVLAVIGYILYPKKDTP